MDTENSRKTQIGRIVPWPVQLALLGLFVLAGLLIWTTNQVLTQRFSEDSQAEAEVQLSLFSGDLISELERQQVVPSLLARDPDLTKALMTRDFTVSNARLQQHRAEIGASALSLLDANGQVVASTKRSSIGAQRRYSTYFRKALETEDTVFATERVGQGPYSFFFSRRIEDQGLPAGVVLVEIDPHNFLHRWFKLADAVALLDETGQVLLATEAEWVGLQEEELAEEARAGDWLYETPHVFSANEEAQAAAPGGALVRQESHMEFHGWRLVSYSQFGGVRERVNTFLAVEIMGFAILLALMFFILSRQADQRSRRFARESDRLRRLNERLQAEVVERERAERNLQVAELSLVQSSKLAALGEMSAAVSHELNQPLAAMKTYLAGARLLVQRERSDEALDSFARIDDLLDRMGAITRQLKAHARKETGDPRVIDLRNCVDATMEIMGPQISRAAAQVQLNLPETAVFVSADPVKLEQVLMNLLRNALEATEESPDPCVTLTLIQDSGQATLTVQDNGGGIADLQSLFEPFYTTKPPGQGVGLGLAISSGIIKTMEGRLTARNGAECGAVFRIDLPLVSSSGSTEDALDPTRGTAAE